MKTTKKADPTLRTITVAEWRAELLAAKGLSATPTKEEAMRRWLDNEFVPALERARRELKRPSLRQIAKMLDEYDLVEPRFSLGWTGAKLAYYLRYVE